jgi:ABC-2 type transport system ATP-binding protein
MPSTLIGASARNPETVTESMSVPKQRFTAISLRHLSKTYPSQFPRLRAFFRRPVKPPVEALREVSFEIQQGEIFGLIGRNGAGKTTLTKIVATLVQPTSGSVSVNGYDSVRDDQRVRRQIGLAGAEERSFYWRLTGDQNLLFFARLYGMPTKAAQERISELLSLLDLKDTARRRFAELSTGNKQRLSVARALLASPPVLLLDEPTRSLDPLAAARMRELIRALSRGDPPVTILFTSHNLAEVEDLCDRVAIISRGRIRALDTASRLRALRSEAEQVRITASDIDPANAQRALAAVVPEGEIGSESGWVTLKFTRQSGDERLDQVLKHLQQDGAIIRRVDIEQPTLLDVLESYEQAEDGTGTKP